MCLGDAHLCCRISKCFQWSLVGVYAPASNPTLAISCDGLGPPPIRALSFGGYSFPVPRLLDMMNEEPGSWVA